jgi:hypothetical protein
MPGGVFSCTFHLFLKNPGSNSIPMKKDPMYYDVHRAKIYKTIYRPSSNLVRFVKSLMVVLMSGNSPISTSYAKRRLH